MVKVLRFKFQQCFGPFILLLVGGSSQTGLFRHLSNQVFKNPQVQKYMSAEGDLFFKMVKIESRFRKCKKNLKKYFFSEIIASEDVAINSVY